MSKTIDIQAMQARINKNQSESLSKISVGIQAPLVEQTIDEKIQAVGRAFLDAPSTTNVGKKHVSVATPDYYHALLNGTVEVTGTAHYGENATLQSHLQDVLQINLLRLHAQTDPALQDLLTKVAVLSLAPKERNQLLKAMGADARNEVLSIIGLNTD